MTCISIHAVIEMHAMTYITGVNDNDSYCISAQVISSKSDGCIRAVKCKLFDDLVASKKGQKQQQLPLKAKSAILLFCMIWSEVLNYICHAVFKLLNVF